MSLFDVFASDYPITLSVLLVLWLIVRPQRSIVRWMWNDQSPRERLLSRAAIVVAAIALAWITVFDNWRQLLGFLVDKKDRWRSDPYLFEPPADIVRVITFTLVALTVLGGAYLYARYARGYLMPIVLAPVAFAVFYVLNSFRMRFELEGPLSERGVDWTHAGEALMTIVWFAMFYAVMAILIACAYLIFWGPASIVVSLLYRNTIGRQRIEEPEMYRILRERRGSQL